MEEMKERMLRSLAYDNEETFVADLITAVLNSGAVDQVIEELKELGYENAMGAEF